eukprot:13887206-Alexandrium_andersonii.AAC.1
MARGRKPVHIAPTAASTVRRRSGAGHRCARRLKGGLFRPGDDHPCRLGNNHPEDLARGLQTHLPACRRCTHSVFSGAQGGAPCTMPSWNHRSAERKVARPRLHCAYIVSTEGGGERCRDGGAPPPTPRR